MTAKRFTFLVVLLLTVALPSVLTAEGEKSAVKETVFEGPNKLTIKVRMEGPYDADTPLQVVCYFGHKKEGDKTLGAAIELDKRLKGAIASLRKSGQFPGDELETILLIPPENSIRPKMLLLIGLGDEASLSLERMERVGRVALREASRLGVSRAAFAPLIRDQGNTTLGTGDVEQAVTRGMLLAYDTEVRLQNENLGKPFTLDTWVVEAGPDYFDATVKGIEKAIEQVRKKGGATN
jgi:hypothetical protein